MEVDRQNDGLRVLHVTNMWPDESRPHYGVFVRAQIDSLREAGVDCDVVHVGGGGLRKYLALQRETQARIDSFRPHIVHAHYGWTGAAVAHVCNAAKLPFIISYCGGDLNGETGGLLRRVKHRLGVSLSLWAAKQATGLIVKNPAMRELIPSGLLGKTRLFPNGVDTERFRILDRAKSKRKLGWPTTPMVLFGGRPDDPTKNFALAEQVMQNVRRKLSEVSLKTIRGVPHGEVPVWLNGTDTVLLTSLKEGSPNMVKEAIACGTPVVSVDVGDVGQVLSGLDGCCVTEYDADRLAQGILRILGAPVERELLRRRLFELDLDSRTVAKCLISWYRVILS